MTHRARKFLVVVDHTPECLKALRFAVRRAQYTYAQVQMLMIVAPELAADSLGINQALRQEVREQAEQRLLALADEVRAYSGVTADWVIAIGMPHEELLRHIHHDSEISVVVLGASTDRANPGPLVRQIALSDIANLHLPVTIVPGGMSDAQIDAVS